MKTRYLFQAVLAMAALAFTGCQSFVENLTPKRIEANASEIYTFRVKVDENMRDVIKGTMKVDVVVGGETHAMHPDPAMGKYVWMFEYKVPSTVSTVPYYYTLHYQRNGNDGVVDEVAYSTDFTPDNKPFISSIVNRYVAQISSSRGPVGTTIGVLGQGFTEFDKVVVGDVEANTTFVSRSQLNFDIPPIPAGETYQVSVRTGDGDLSAGTLRVDPAAIGVQPEAINLSVGDSMMVTFYIDGSAPVGGLVLNVTTNIPNDVVMPEVIIPTGQRSVSVPVQGMHPASGSLWVTADGYDEKQILITIE